MFYSAYYELLALEEVVSESQTEEGLWSESNLAHNFN